jgi:invasion protein IalB
MIGRQLRFWGACLLALAAGGGACAQQAQTPAAGQPAAPAQPASPPPPQPFRTEILAFDNWTVTCREFAEGKRKRFCFATLQVVQQNTSQAVFVWTIGYDDDNHPAMTFQTPSGVLIAPGVELKTPKGTRAVPFVSCEPGRCTATAMVDPAFLKDLATTTGVDASIHASAGNTVRFDIPMKGFDKALAALK